MPNVLKSGSLNLLEPSGPVQACTGIAALAAVTSSKYCKLFQAYGLPPSYRTAALIQKFKSDMKNHTKPKAFLPSGVSPSPHLKYARLTCGSKYSLETQKRKLRVYKFSKSGNHLKIQGAGKVTCSKFHTVELRSSGLLHSEYPFKRRIKSHMP